MNCKPHEVDMVIRVISGVHGRIIHTETLRKVSYRGIPFHLDSIRNDFRNAARVTIDIALTPKTRREHG